MFPCSPLGCPSGPGSGCSHVDGPAGICARGCLSNNLPEPLARGRAGGWRRGRSELSPGSAACSAVDSRSVNAPRRAGCLLAPTPRQVSFEAVYIPAAALSQRGEGPGGRDLPGAAGSKATPSPALCPLPLSQSRVPATVGARGGPGEQRGCAPALSHIPSRVLTTLFGVSASKLGSSAVTAAKAKCKPRRPPPSFICKNNPESALAAAAALLPGELLAGGGRCARAVAAPAVSAPTEPEPGLFARRSG